MLVKVDIDYGIYTKLTETVELNFPDVAVELAASWKEHQFYYGNNQFYYTTPERIVLEQGPYHQHCWYAYDVDDLETFLEEIVHNYVVGDNHYLVPCNEPHIYDGEIIKHYRDTYQDYIKVNSLLEGYSFGYNPEKLKILKPEVFTSTKELRRRRVEHWLKQQSRNVESNRETLERAESYYREIQSILEELNGSK